MAVVYRCFSEETWKLFDKTGKNEVIEATSSALIDKDPALKCDPANKDINTILYEVVWAVIHGHLKLDQAKALLFEIMGMHRDLCSQLVEVLYLVELELTTHEPFSKNRDNLLKLMMVLGLERMYRERLELETLSDIGIAKNKKLFHTKQIKVRTKMFYKQQKFNLLREECEGYAKLVTELNQALEADISPQSILQVIRSLIGCFNLDPNRVLDLILEGMECRPAHHNFYTSLLKLFPFQTATLTELLGFRMSAGGSSIQTQKPVYTCMALLVQAGVLTVDEIYGWLTPDDNEMVKEHQAAEEAAHEFARKANVISTKDKDKDKEKKEEKDEETKERELLSDKRYNDNQKIQFCVALLEAGDWEHFQELLGRFPDYYLTSCMPICNALAQLCHVTVEPCYRRISDLPPRAGGIPVSPLNNPYAIEQCHTFDEVAERVLPMVCALGPHVARNPLLMVKLLRIARVSLSEQTDKNVKDNFYYDFLSVLDESLLPGLSVLVCNPCIAEEIWETIKLYPYECRFKLYGSWKNESMNIHPVLIRTKTTLLKRAKYVMMRVTKETIKPISRSIAKLTHSCPPTILDYVVKQIQLYDNLIAPVVDSLKYLSSLSFDVLAFCIVETLTANKERLINAGMAVSPWLNSLSSFCGAVYKKYSIELCGVMQFIANQLKAGRSVDLLLLQEILQKMGGIDTTEDLTAEQLEAMCGGEILRREAGTYQQERNIKRSSQRLKEVLLQNDLAIPLLLLIAQQRSCIVYNQTESPHLKLVGKLYDQCQETLVQFGSYLFQVATLEEITERLPSIGELISDCHINPDVAFFLIRPHVTAKINARFDEVRRSNRSEDKKQLYIDSCNEVLSPLVEEIRPHFPSKIWEEMHPSFFLTFWSLSLNDLEVPKKSYKKEIAKLSDMLSQLQKYEKNDPPGSAAASKRKKEVERVVAMTEKLTEEEAKQDEHVERVIARLTQDKDRWFTQRAACLPKNDTVTAFLQLCLFPRCTFTTLDALYCARFVKMMHELKTPNFSTLILCDRMFCDITYSVASCTEQEAHRYGQFLQGTLEMVMHWHASSDNYEKECAKFPGFVTRFRVSKMESNDYVDYENYRHVVHKWHFKITKALVTCLESGDYIQIRNAILVLQNILSCFPAIVNLANVVDKRIEKVKKDEKNNRNDLYVLANSYSGRLRAKKPKLLSEKDFHQVRKPEEKPQSQGASGSQPVANGVDSKSKGASGDSKADDSKKDEQTDNKDTNRSESTEDNDSAASQKKATKRSKPDSDGAAGGGDGDDVQEVDDSDDATDGTSADGRRKSKRQKVDNSSKRESSSHRSSKRQEVSESPKRSHRKREPSVDEATAEAESKKAKKDRKSNGRPVEAEEKEVVEVEEKKRSTRRK